MQIHYFMLIKRSNFRKFRPETFGCEKTFRIQFDPMYMSMYQVKTKIESEQQCLQ